jgi:hypothetical protein
MYVNSAGYSFIYPYLFLYGVEASMTTLCCLLAIYSEGLDYGLTQGELYNLVGVYLPTFFIPLYIAFDTFTRDWTAKDIKKLD